MEAASVTGHKTLQMLKRYTYIGRFNPAAARRMAERIKAAALESR